MRQPWKISRIWYDALLQKSQEFVETLSLTFRQKKSQPYHKTVIKPGTVFLWKDNMQYQAYSRAPFEINVPRPQQLTITLKDENGKKWKFPHPDIDNQQWGNKKWINKINGWWKQVMRRCVDRNDPEHTKPKTSPMPWTIMEKDHLQRLIRERNKEIWAITDNDWEEIINEQNRRFEGTSFPRGLGLAVKEREGRKNVRSPFLAENRTMTKRSIKSIKGMVTRWNQEEAIKMSRSGRPGGLEDDDYDLMVSDDSSEDVQMALESGYITDGDQVYDKEHQPIFNDDEDMGGMG